MQHALVSKDAQLRLDGLLVLNILAAFGNLKEHILDVAAPICKAATVGLRDDERVAAAALSAMGNMMKADALGLDDRHEVVGAAVKSNLLHIAASAFERVGTERPWTSASVF